MMSLRVAGVEDRTCVEPNELVGDIDLGRRSVTGRRLSAVFAGNAAVALRRMTDDPPAMHSRSPHQRP